MKMPYADAFAGQIALLRARIDNGMSRFGWKVGINVPEVRPGQTAEAALGPLGIVRCTAAA